MSETTIRLENVRLDVPAVYRHQSIKSLLLRRNARSEMKSILDIPNFEAKKGDRICVIGKNGHGKTTFMKVLSGIYRPTHGSIWTSHKPTAVLAAGIGLEDELTVEENINISLILRNVPRKRIRQLKGEILDFCELEGDRGKQFKHLSTGFRSRLSFAIAISDHPTILVLDEVLGGGDEFFMKRAKQKLFETIEAADTALIATHGPDEMRDICNRLVLIEDGKAIYDGSFDEGLKFYRERNA